MDETSAAAVLHWLAEAEAHARHSPIISVLVVTNLVAAVLCIRALAAARRARREVGRLDAERADLSARYETATLWRRPTASPDSALATARPSVET